MRGRLVRMSLALAVLLLLSAVPSLAQGRGRAKSKVQNTAVVVMDTRSHDGDDSRRRDAVRGRRHARADRVRVLVRDRGIFRDSHRPPGWDRGRKVGWGNCNLPPGLAKKHGCSGFVVRDARFPRRGPVIVIPVR